MSSGPFVVDTNVVVAGLLTSDLESPTARLLDAMLRGEVRYLLSEELLAEYRAVLLRPKIVAAHGLAVEEVDEVLVRLAANGAFRVPPEAGTRGDDHLFALLAAETGARLVSGDSQVIRRAGARGRSPRQVAGALP